MGQPILTRYKLTSQDMTTHNGYRIPPFGWYYPERRDGNAKPCTNTVLHHYASPLLAVLLNPIHASIDNPRLFEVEILEEVGTDGLKGWSREQRIVRELPLPTISSNQRVAFGLLCSLEVYKTDSFVMWVEEWLSGKDRTAYAASAASAAADAAARAAYAARAADAAQTAYAARAADAAQTAYAARAADAAQTAYAARAADAAATAYAARAADAAQTAYAARAAARATHAAYAASRGAYAAARAADAAAHAADAAAHAAYAASRGDATHAAHAAARAAYAASRTYSLDFPALAEKALLIN